MPTLYEKIWGVPVDGPEDDINPYLKRIASRFRQVLVPYARAFVQQTVYAAQQGGFLGDSPKDGALPYLWFVLLRNKPSWPDLDPMDKASLFAMLKLASIEHTSPNPSGVATLPDVSVEPDIDVAIKYLASWSHGEINKPLRKQINNICTAEVKQYRRKHPEFSNPTMGYLATRGAFKAKLFNSPLFFNQYDPYLLWPFVRIISPMFGAQSKKI